MDGLVSADGGNIIACGSGRSTVAWGSGRSHVDCVSVGSHVDCVDLSRLAILIGINVLNVLGNFLMREVQLLLPAVVKNTDE